MRGEDPSAPLYSLDNTTALGLATLCSHLTAASQRCPSTTTSTTEENTTTHEDPMATDQQQPKRRRTDSKTTDPESLKLDSPTTIRKQSQSPSSARLELLQQQSLRYNDSGLELTISTDTTEAARSQQLSTATGTTPSAVSTLLQQQSPSYPNSAASPPVSQSHQMSGNSKANNSSVSVTGTVSLATSVASIASSVTLQHPISQKSQQSLVSTHTNPAPFLSQNTTVSSGTAGADYSMWFYSPPGQQQQQQQQQRQQPQYQQPSTNVDNVGIAPYVASLPLTYPVATASMSTHQHTAATSTSDYNSYSMVSGIDSQMRYMAIPGQPSAIPRPIPSGNLDDSSVRPTASQPQSISHVLSPVQYHHISQHLPPPPSSLQQPRHQQYYPGFHGYHVPPTSQQQPNYYQPQQSNPLQTHLLSHPATVQYYSNQQQQSPFPAHGSIAGSLSESSSGPASVRDGGRGGTGHGIFAQEPHMATAVEGDVSATAQMAAAVAAAAISAQHPVSSNSGASPTGNPATAAAIAAAASGNANNLIGMDQSNVPAFKFSMNMPAAGAGSSGLPEYFENYQRNYMPAAGTSVSRGGVASATMIEPAPVSPTEHTLDPELVVQLDNLFMRYLEQICSNNITVDSEGESIHQTQMAKKLEKLEQCTEFRTFRFRIQAFSNGYREFMEREAGITEQIVSKQQLRNYLQQQRFISRYNEDGKKAKSKGHHVWNVEAKKMSRNTWWFKEFLRRIQSPPPKAIAGAQYEWIPTIWDPQIKAPKVYFSSEWLPSWLSWENNVLRGVTPKDASDVTINVVASYYQGKEVCHLKNTYTISVIQHTPLNQVFMA